MATEDDQFFQQLFCLIAEIHHVAIKQPVNQASFRGQGRIIHLLAHNEGLSQRELAGLAQIKPGSVSEVLERLEKTQMIKRWRDKKDRRIVRVQLTDRGKNLYKENLQKRRQFEKEMLAPISAEERATFLTVLEKMQVQLRKNYGDLLPKSRREGE